MELGDKIRSKCQIVSHRLRQIYGLEVMPSDVVAYINLLVTDGLTPYANAAVAGTSCVFLINMAEDDEPEDNTFLVDLSWCVNYYGDTIHDRTVFPLDVWNTPKPPDLY